MESKTREERVLEIMTNMVNNLLKKGPLSLNAMAEPYRSSNEMGLCLMAFSRLEAEGLIIQRPDDRWKLSRRML